MHFFVKYITAASIILFSGCAAYYAQNGYYESSKIPGWSYDIIDTLCSFYPSQSNPVGHCITFSTTSKGRLFMRGYFEVPVNNKWEIEGVHVVVISSDGKKSVQDISVTIKTPYATTDGYYGFSSEDYIAGEVVEGFTLERPRAIVWRKLPREVEFIAQLEIESSDRFSIILPEIKVNGRYLNHFSTQFIWNNQTKYVFKGI